MIFCPKCGRPGWMVGKNIYRCVNPECGNQWSVDPDEKVKIKM